MSRVTTRSGWNWCGDGWRSETHRREGMNEPAHGWWAGSRWLTEQSGEPFAASLANNVAAAKYRRESPEIVLYGRTRTPSVSPGSASICHRTSAHTNHTADVRDAWCRLVTLRTL